MHDAERTKLLMSHEEADASIISITDLRIRWHHHQHAWRGRQQTTRKKQTYCLLVVIMAWASKILTRSPRLTNQVMSQLLSSLDDSWALAPLAKIKSAGSEDNNQHTDIIKGTKSFLANCTSIPPNIPGISTCYPKVSKLTTCYLNFHIGT